MSHVVGQNSLTPSGNNNTNLRLAHDQVVFLENAALPLPQEMFRVSGKQNSLFSLGSVMKCLLPGHKGPP